MELILPVRPLDGEPEDVVVDVETSRTVNDLAGRSPASSASSNRCRRSGCSTG